MTEALGLLYEVLAQREIDRALAARCGAALGHGVDLMRMDMRIFYRLAGVGLASMFALANHAPFDIGLASFVTRSELVPGFFLEFRGAGRAQRECFHGTPRPSRPHPLVRVAARLA